MLETHSSFFFIILVLQYDTINAFNIPCFDPSSRESTQYNPATELCCSGWVYIKENSHSQCCNTFVFNSQTEVCCNGHISTQTGGLTECCGLVPYDPSSATCCVFNGNSTLYAGRGSCCGNQGLYDPSQEVCCSSYTDNVFKVHTPLSSERCCGSELYDAHLETCCNEKILHGVGNCCGSSVCDDSKEICCEGTVHPKPSNEAACCGNLVINQRTSTCCYGRVYNITDGECCGYEAFQPSSSSCCYNVINYNIPQLPGIQRCCGSQSYLSTEQICCSGVLFPKEEHSECCGNVAFDTSTHLCCGEWYNPVIVEKKSSSTSCCGQVTYEPETETCCKRTNQVFPTPGGRCCIMENGQEEMYDPRSGVCCSYMFSETFYEGISSFDNTTVCCGTYLLEEHQLCDWINLVPVVKSSPSDDMVCSGITADDSQTYNALSMICSHGTLIPLQSTETVCGNQVMDERTEICCGGSFVHARYDENNEERQCCEGSFFPYTPSKQICCSSMIYDIPEDEGRCCGYRGYSFLTEVCEGNSIVKPIGKPDICGYHFYSRKNHFCCGDQELIGPGYTCCNGNSFNTGTENINGGGCCGGIGYNPVTHICCGSKIHERTSRDLDCCGNGTFSTHQKEDHICCNGALQRTHHGRIQCQGTTAFNPDRETVCDGVRYPVLHGTCCGSSLMDAETEICCEGTAFPKSSSTSLACCGSIAYDSEDPSKVCCQDVLHHNGDGKACCGTHVYNPKLQQCCGNNDLHYLYAKQEHHHCCGILLYNSTKHQCCAGTLLSFHADVPCCGNDISTRVDTLCCEGHPVRKVFGASSKCCGRNVYDQTTQECLASDLGNVIVEKQGNEVYETSVQCLESVANVTSDDLAETFANFSSVIIITPPVMKKRSNREVCKTRITKVLKFPPGTNSQWLSKGLTLHLGQTCPCAGIYTSAVLFTNHLIAQRNFEPSNGDVIMASSRKIRSALKELKLI